MDLFQAVAQNNLYWLAISVAGVAGYGLGAVWYSVLRKAWLSAAGLTQKKVRSGNMPIIYGLTLVLSFVVAIFLSLLGPSTWQSGAVLGAQVFLVFGLPVLVTHYLFTLQPLRLYFIDLGYDLLRFALMGAIVGGWH